MVGGGRHGDVVDGWWFFFKRVGVGDEASLCDASGGGGHSGGLGGCREFIKVEAFSMLGG